MKVRPRCCKPLDRPTFRKRKIPKEVPKYCRSGTVPSTNKFGANRDLPGRKKESERERFQRTLGTGGKQNQKWSRASSKGAEVVFMGTTRNTLQGFGQRTCRGKKVGRASGSARPRRAKKGDVGLAIGTNCNWVLLTSVEKRKAGNQIRLLSGAT